MINSTCRGLLNEACMFFFLFTEEDICSEVSVRSKRQTTSTAVLLVKQLKLLTTLDISGYKISNKGANMIAVLLMKATSLKVFDVSNSTLNTEKAITINNSLKSLSSLKILIANNNDICDKVANSTAAVIQNNPLLEKLNISHNWLTSVGLLQIAKALLLASKHIKIFDISNNFIASDNVEMIFTALSNCSTLEELYVSHNLLTFNSVLIIAQCFRHHPTLHTLDLSKNITTFSSACEFIVDIILSVNRKLLNLNVCGRNIRPRFVDDYLSPPNSEKVLNCFALQNLYLLQPASLNTINIQTKIIKAQTESCPLSDENIISYYVDHTGGVFYNQYHNCTLVIPPNAVSQGECAEIQVTASYYGPYEIPDGFYPVSSFFWISADYTFKASVYIILNHYAKIRSLEDISHLYVLQTSACDSVTNGKKLEMKTVPDRVYFDCEIGYCVLATRHFCSYCQAKDDKHIPEYLVASYYTYDDDISSESYVAEVCFCPSNSECKKVHVPDHLHTSS